MLRLVLQTEESGSVLGALAYLSQFFTILTNAAVCLLLGAVALGAPVAPRVTQAFTIAIVGVGVVYHVALAHLRELSGLELLGDHGVHTVVPLLTFLWWLFWAPKSPLRATYALVWIAWPVLYCIYILIRAAGSGFYPYPFLNLPELGVVGLAQSIAVLCAAFVVIGLALTGMSRLVARRTVVRATK